MLKKTLMAMAGVTAGASTALAGTAAHAAAPTMDQGLSEVTSERAPRAVCQEASVYPYNPGNRGVTLCFVTLAAACTVVVQCRHLVPLPVPPDASDLA